MNLSAPTQLFFIISLVIAIIGVLMGLGILAMIPVPSFWVVALAWVVLAIGCLMPGV